MARRKRIYPSKEQGIEKPETTEKIESEMESGEEEENVYSEEGREKLAENDEMEPFEEGFMEGAEGRGQRNCCAECGKLLGEDEENIIEREFEGDLKWFCSEKHAKDFLKKHKEKEYYDKTEE